MSHRSMVGTQICPYLDWKCPDISANWRCYNDYCLCDLSACSGLCYNSQWGRCGEGHNIHESICWSHQEPMDWPWDPAMLQSEERIPDLRLSRIVSGNRDQINISSLFQVPLILKVVPSFCDVLSPPHVFTAISMPLTASLMSHMCPHNRTSLGRGFPPQVLWSTVLPSMAVSSGEPNWISYLSCMIRSESSFPGALYRGPTIYEWLIDWRMY